MKNTNVVIYTRASLQSEKALNEQLESCREFCRNNGFEVVGEYSDVGSGLVNQRADLQRMVSDLQSNDVHDVVVHRFDRLSRDAHNITLLKDKFNQYGIGLISVVEGNVNNLVNSIAESLSRIEGAEEH